MTDAPNNTAGTPADLGSAYAELGFRYNRQGIQQFITDANTAVQAHTRVAQSARQVVSVNTTQVVRQTAGQVAAIQRTQITADARLQQARVAGVARVEAAEKAATARTAAAQLAAQARVESQRLRGVTQLEIAERRIAAQQARAAGPALPRTFAGFTRSGITQALGAAGLITSVDQLVGKIKDVTDQSIELANTAEKIGPAFEESAARAGVAADDLLTLLRNTSRGTISDLQLQLNATRAIELGVAQNAEQLANLLTIAQDRARRFGLTAQEAFERIVLGVGKAEPEILDELGLILDANQAYEAFADSVGRSTDSLSKQEKVQIIVNKLIADNRDVLNEAGDAALSNAEKQEAAAARIQNAQVRFGRAAAPIRAGVVENVAGFAELLTGTFFENQERQQAALIQAADNYQAYIQAVQDANAALGLDNPISRYLFGIQALNEELFNEAQALITAGRSADEASAQVQAMAEANALLETAVLRNVPLLSDLAPLLQQLGNRSPEAARQVTDLIKTFDPDNPDAFRQAVQDLQRSLEGQGNAAATAAPKNDQLAQAQKRAADQAERLKDAQEAMTDAVIRAGDEIADAQTRRDDALQDALDSYNDRVDELNERSAEIASETQAAINEAVADGQDQRADIVEAGAERVADIEQELGERITDITERYHRDVAEEETRFQREQQQARERARVDALRGEADFISRLFDLTRGSRGGRADRQEARAQLEAAKREAAELARIDPEAASRLLAARERQIIEALERRREEAQQRRDAARGRPGFSRTDADAEAREERAAIDAANAAEIEQIRREAEQRQQARDTEQQQRTDDYNEQLQEARAAADAQIADTQEQTREQLAVFDERQRQRIAQIQEHGREQQIEIAGQLREEEASYRESRAQIEQEYGESLDRIRDELNDRAAEIFFPDETERSRLRAAYQSLGEEIGAAFVNAIASIRPPGFIGPLPVPGFAGSPTAPATSATRSRARGSRVEAPIDAILSDQAIDQIVVGGRQTGSFNGVRSGNVHQGVDIATPLNSPVRSPVDGTVVAVGSTREGGNYMIVEAANGDQWYLGHLNAATVERGAKVRRGQPIARSGATGTAITGPHVHVQLRTGQNNRVTDPTAALERIAGAPVSTQTARSVTPVSTTTAQRPRTVTGTPSQLLPGEPLSSAFVASAQLAGVAPLTNNTTVGGPNITIDNRGAVYGTGVDMQEIERTQYNATIRALSEYDQQFNRQITQIATSGPRIAG